MHIAYIVPKLANKGPVIVVLELVRQMLRHGHTCKVFYFDPEQEIQFPCPVERITVSHAIDFRPFDIIHTHGLRPDCYVFVHKPRHCRAGVLSTLHNYILADFSYQYNPFVAYTAGNLWMCMLCRHDKLITLTRNALQYYTRWFKPEKLACAYNTRTLPAGLTVTADEEAAILRFKGSSPLIGVHAALTPRKGIDQLIQALPLLPDYKLMVVGDGKSLEPLRQQSLANGTSSRVWFTGYRKDACRYLPYYDIYALPSRSEGFVLTLIEAALYKKKVVCSDLPVFREVVDRTEVSFFQLEDIPSLVDAIRRAREDDSLGEHLYQKYLQAFSPEIFYQTHLAIYQSVLETKKHS